MPAASAERLAPVAYLGGAAPASLVPVDPAPALDPSDSEAPYAAPFAVAVADVDVDVDEEETPESAAVRSAADRERAEAVLLQRLRARSLSMSEARAVLAGTEIDPHEIEEVIERFTELAYIDEGRLADQIVHSHHERKGLGRSGVQAEMRRRGIDPELILEKLDEMPDDETERAIEIACKRVGQLGRLDDQTIDRRLNAFLMRKGYNSSIVRVAVKAAMDSRGGSTSRVRFQ
ncbi:RecX family transcriptional regulator [Cryobacterium breve]|uniref:Regulatory protein RecX n=2 Tax=Microbacteriaceae TaxID=85023 RepID=A0ABY2JCT3_9MICO|nr:RecX family transcriptional regulator [Cryobacterium sp. TmT3-12]TFD01626.1 RecX family transcriptional regulator [Cryobacterium breve]